jgi:ATP-dependent DNA helicase DinG
MKELVFMSKGGALMLFTSYKRMEDYFRILKDEFIDKGIIVQKQGDETREFLLNRMISLENCVLFATSSFWEGIDIPGYNLRLVIIEKIPFDSLSDPIYKAKTKLLEYKGLNSFVIYSIPRAVLRLKQGIGRLIRTKSDKGIIAILDERIKTKNYGKTFINSFPPARIIYGGVEKIIENAKRFIESNF